MGKPKSAAAKNAVKRSGRRKKVFAGVRSYEVLKKRRQEGVDAYMEREGMLCGPSHGETASKDEPFFVTDERMLLDDRPTGCPGQLATPNEDHSILDGRPTSSVAVCETPKRRRRPNEDTLDNLVETPNRMRDEEPMDLLAETPKRRGESLEDSFVYPGEVTPRNRVEDPSAVPAAPTALPGNRIFNAKFLDYQMKEDVDHSCHFSNMAFIREVMVKGRSCVSTQLLYKCTSCNHERSYKCQPDDEDLDAKLVAGIISAGVGYAAAATIFAAANLPFMSEKKFIKVQERVGEHIRAGLDDSMAAAGKEERRLAVEAGDVLANGIPFITVVADGAWGKRSYKTKYNSLSGVVSIIGKRTKRVLWLGMRNKYCSICPGAKGGTVKDHKCFKNWDKSAGAMESDMVWEGFNSSLKMHGLAYTSLIGDNDSSVMRRLRVGKPYGAENPIKKVECRNHIFRNLDTNLGKLVKNTGYPLWDRKALDERKRHFRKGVKGSIKHWRKTAARTVDKVANLRYDICNIPKHVFGYHKDCATYFCHEDKADSEERSLFEIMSRVKSQMAQALMLLMEKLASHAESLIEDVDSNICESFNSIANKMLSGKRIFYGARGSYNTRMEAAALQFNLGESLEEVTRRVAGGKTPGSKTKRHVACKLATKVRKARSRLKFHRYKPKVAQSQAGPSADYGAATVDDIPASLLQDMKEDHLRKLSAADPDRILIQTMGQNKSDVWHAERSLRLTASNFGSVMSLRPETCTRNRVYSILYADLSKVKAVRFGIENEGRAKQVFCQKYNKEITDCGLFVDRQHPFLAASPDGLVVNEDAVLEIKCLWAASDAETENFADALGKNLLPQFSKKDRLLKLTSKWMYQIQGQLNITGRHICYLFLWTPLWDECFAIYRNEDLWSQTMVPKLEKFYNIALLPEIVAPLYGEHQIKEHIRESFIVD